MRLSIKTYDFNSRPLHKNSNKKQSLYGVDEIESYIKVYSLVSEQYDVSWLDTEYYLGVLGMGRYKKGLYKKEEALLEHYNSNVNYGSVNVDVFFKQLSDIDFENKRVLDLGCEDGRFSARLKGSLGAHPFGVDFSKERIKKAKYNRGYKLLLYELL